MNGGSERGGLQRIGGDLLVRDACSYPGGPSARRLDLRIVGGRVEEVGDELDAQGCETLDAHGLVVIPGLIDVHVHFRDPGLARKEGWESGSSGALHGGVTAVVEVQNNPPLSISRESLEARIAHVRARSRVDFGCLANLLPASVDQLEAMAPLTPAFKLFLGGSTGLGGQADRETQRGLFQAAARAGRMIVAHCEDDDLLREGRASHPDATAAEHHLVRSSEAETVSIQRAIELVRETGARLHVFHVSTGEGVELIRAARDEGLWVRASTAPHYVHLCCEDAARLGNLLKVNPSVKTRADREAIVAGLADGTIDAIGTDHAPHPLDEKQRVYAKAPSGMPSIDLLWPLTWELVRSGRLDAETALASVSSRAATSLDLPGKGEIAAGWDGDLVLFDPEAKRRVVGAELPSRSKWSAYEGMELAGWPELVVRRGIVAWQRGAPCATAGGEPLALHAPRPARMEALE